ncbi:phenol hydroxylase subunit P4 [Xanthobacter oligotrophicus]|uniref:Phenol hydroxylase subunit P4 n=1 Tax=Xanthobacter oligotrophicus TaxID=2607286 RepID=A0ABW6ZZY0_9HYPH
MTIRSTKNYVGVPRDLVANFGGRQLVYVSWDQHLLFAAPFLICVPPETPFRELVQGPLSALLAPDPDAGAIDWSKAQWLKANAPWVPEFDRTLAENGIGHKALLRFRTPGLNSVMAA